MSASSATELPGVTAADAASRGGATGEELSLQRGALLEELMQFPRWSIFLPRAYSVEAEKNHTYVRSRHTRNPKFFEETRARLHAIICDLKVLSATGGESTEEALETVLQAQWTAVGFLCDRQFHKALTLGEFCLELVEALAAQGAGGGGGLIFWRLLVRVNLGDAYARFKQPTEAIAVLKQGLELVEQFSGMSLAANDVRTFGEGSGQAKEGLKSAFGSRERVLAGAIYSHLSRIHLEAGDHDEALRLTELMVEAFERFIWDLGDSKEDREAEASVLATAYSHRGVCDVRRGKHESALAWLQRAQECIEKNADLSGDSEPILALIKDHIVHARHLHI